MKSSYKGLIILVLVGLAVYIPYRFSYAWFTNPSGCVKCHEVKPYHESWKEYPHKKTDCRDCHETRGPFRRLDSLSRGVRDLAIQIKGDYFAMRAVYYDTNCINCHTGDYKPESKAPSMPKNHAKMIKNGEGCNNCHRDAGHENGLGVEAKFEKD